MADNKPALLFVDDDNAVLQGLRRMLWSQREQWEMHFACSGAEALQLLEGRPFDILITDMRMPGMGGLELLTLVQEKYPGVMRIALSGQSDKEVTMKVVHPAHQYLSKPCSAEIIKNTITKALGLQSILDSDLLRETVSQVGSLPSLPEQYQAILAELNSPDTSIHKVGKIVASDLGMSALVLKIVNSAFFGFYREITNPVQAVNVLGLDTLKSLVLSHHIFSEYRLNGELGSLLHHLWDHSLKSAVFAKKIAQSLGGSRQMVGNSFLAGMMHDIGILIFASQLPEYYLPVYRLCQREGLKLWYAETETFGASHAELGAYLLGLWGLETEVLEAIAFHHQPLLAGNTDIAPLTAVHVADYLEHNFRNRFSVLNNGYLQDLKIEHHLEEWKKLSEHDEGNHG